MPTILVADDNSNIQKMVSLALEGRGMQVVAVGNGEAAVRKIAEVHPDVVLADVFMPVRNGYEVCEFVKKDSRLAQTPVILLVGAFDPLDEKEARRVGADGVLKKPFVPPDPLITMVFSVLEKTGKSAPAAQPAPSAPEAAALPPAPPKYSEPEPQPRPEPEFDEFAVGSGPLRFRDEDNSPPFEAPSGSAGSGSEARNPWDEPQSEWERRRAQMDFEVPERSGQQSSATYSDSESAIPSNTEAVGAEDFVPEEFSQASVEPGTLAELAANPEEWIEMMSTPFSGEPSESKKSRHAPAPPSGPPHTESESWQAQKPADKASSKRFPWQDERPTAPAPLETTAASEVRASPLTHPEVVSEAVNAPPEAPYAFPRTTEAAHEVPDAELLSEPIQGWSSTPGSGSAAGTSAEWLHTEAASELSSAWNSAPAAQQAPPANEPAPEDAPKPEYELLIAPAAAIPIHPTTEPPAPWPSAGHSAPRDLQAGSTSQESESPSPYASYLPSETSSDVVPTSEQDVVRTSQQDETKTPQTHPAASAPNQSLPAPPLADPAIMDAVVAQVLERLRPELQEILSQESVRSLVQSVLQRELQKK